MIAALNAAAAPPQVNVDDDTENIDPLQTLKQTSAAKDFDVQEEQSESSFETVIHINPKPWSESTPAVPRTRKSMARGRKSTKRKSSVNTTNLYPQLSMYPDLSENALPVPPSTSTEQFGKIAECILEEMNTRAAGTY